MPPQCRPVSDRAQPAEHDELAALVAGLDRPVDPEPLVGRRGELEAVRALLMQPAVDLLTLTGPAGVGKSRLAREIAADLADALDGRVLRADLPPDADLSVVATTIARRLELPAGQGGAAASGPAGDRPALLVLEHAEGALATVPAIAALRAACPDLKILVTARRPLRVRGEQTFAVPPLAAPDSAGPLDLATVTSSPAVELFVRRARAADPRFALGPDNCAAVGSICHRLTGLPLALELAARCCQRLPPSAILALLADRTEATGVEQVPRWGALGRAAAANCRLMSPDERVLFRRLAVFVGGCTPDAAEVVCHDRAGLAGLVGRGLLQPGPGADGTLRLHMPEPIRELARDLLAGSPDGDDLARRHAAFFLALAEEASAGLAGANQRHWLDVLEREHDNLRAALRHYAEVGAAEPGLRLASALSRFWSTRGYLGEGRAWLGRFLRRGESTGPIRTRAQVEAARLACCQGDDATAYALSSEGLASDQAGGRVDEIASRLDTLALACWRRGNAPVGCSHSRASIDLAFSTGDVPAQATGHHSLGKIMLDQGDCAAARLSQERSLALFTRLDDRQGVAMALCGLADVASAENDGATARRLYERSLAERLRIADRGGTAEALTGLGRLLLREGATSQAGAHLTAGLAISSGLGDRHGIARALEGLALLEREDAASSLPARSAIERQLIAARQLLHGVVADAREAEACETAPARTAPAVPVEPLPRPRDAQLQRPADPLAADLTRREREVAVLLAQGMTNRQIAERLVLTERTAETHVHNILSKLGLSSRAQIAVWAVANSMFTPAAGWRRVAGM